LPVGILTETPGLTAELYDAVNDKMNVENDPPEGLILHTSGPMEGGWRIFDVWESAEAFERFTDERLRPAIEEVSGGPAPPEPRQEIYELHTFLSS
jgi:hypothetical protein